jgi:uncharacterized protein (TIGR04141 family)
VKKSRAFSIFLLKEQYDVGNALKDNHGLAENVAADELPPDAKLFVLDAKPKPPWWRGYFGIKKDLLQATKGALVFLPVKGRTFVLSFGFVAHNLKDESYEYDFGLRVTLNCVDPRKLKNTDTLEPGAARRQKTQVAVDSDLTYFDFDRDSKILKSLTGKAKAEYQDLMKHATGASNLRINSPVPAGDLPTLCKKLLELYADDAYRITFPDIQNITPVRDPTVIAQLNALMLDAFHQKSSDLYLAVPAILDYGDNLYTMFGGAGTSLVYDDVFLGRYYEYLSERGIDSSTITVEDLKKHVLKVTDENGVPRSVYTIFRSLIFDTTMAKGVDAYHLVEGDWYRVAKTYIENLASFLDPFCNAVALPEYNHESEGAYNLAVAAGDTAFMCLDKTDISPPGQTQVEPCDLYSVDDGQAVLHHVKVSTFSAALSHLFNQGTNAIALLKSDDDVRDKLRSLVAAKAGKGMKGKLTAPIDDGNFRVVFAMVTHKDTALKSENLPLFSRISLMRDLKALRRMNVAASFGYIRDKSPKKEGNKKPRKPKGTAAT